MLDLSQKRIDEIVRLAVEQSSQRAAEKTIAEFWGAMGYDVGKVEDRNELRSTLLWAQRYKKLSTAIGSRILITVITVLSGGFIFSFWSGFKMKLFG